MTGDRRLRLSERHGMEGGVRCPDCGRYNSFGTIVATGACGAVDCDAGLALELVYGG
jgi:hypothetical protein